MKFPPRRLVVLGTLATMILGSNAHAALTLTAGAASQGFGLSVFASGFPSSGSVGPLGIAFTSTGGVLVSDAPGNVRLFATDTDGQTAASAAIGNNYGNSNAVGLASVGGLIYMTRQSIGDVVQINSNGTFNQGIVTGIPVATGMIANPITGHIFADSNSTGQIFDIDPLAKTKSVFLATGQNIDGLSLSADGSVLYYAATSNGHIYGVNTTTKLQVFDSGAIGGGIDGTALGTGVLSGNIFVNLNNGTVLEIDLVTKSQTLIATGGSRGDFVTVDPNGSLLLTQSNEIYRLTAPTGGSFGAVPEPASVVMVGMGFLGTLIVARRRRGNR